MSEVHADQARRHGVRLMIATFATMAGVLCIMAVESHWEEERSMRAARRQLQSVKLTKMESKDTREVRIGQDCNDPSTPCAYFNPVHFATSQPEFVAEIGAMWTKSKKNVIEALCRRVQPWLTEMYVLECREDADQNNPYCRPPDLDPTMDNFDTYPTYFLPRAGFTFKHVRKAGGNTVIRTLSRLLRPRMYLRYIRASLEPDAELLAEQHMEFIEQQQKQALATNTPQYPLVAVVRNPVAKFVSAAAEIFRDTPRVRDTCADAGDSPEVLKCIMGMVEDKYTNLHVFPMFSDLYCGMKGRDVNVSLYHMDSLQGLLHAMGAHNSEVAHNPRTVDFREEHLDHDMIRRICSIYAWDVAMMEFAGFEVPECKPDYLEQLVRK